MPRKTAQAVADDVLERYLAGALVSTIVEETGLARSTVNKILERSGKTRRRFAADWETADQQTMAGLRELVRYYEQRLDEVERENRSLKRQLSKLKIVSDSSVA